MATSHVFDVIEQSNADPDEKSTSGLNGVVAVFGSERFLKQLAVDAMVRKLGGQEALFSAGRFDGDTATWPDVSDELYTLSLFGGGGPRIAIVDRADSFVSGNRDRISKIVESPPENALLILIVDKWAANTKLYKSLDKSGFQVNCQPSQSREKYGYKTDFKLAG